MSRRKLQICFCEDEFTWLTSFTEKHLFSIVTRQARKQHSPWDIMLSLQTTDRSKVDIRTKRGISHPHYTLISHLPQQKVAGGLTKKKKKLPDRKQEFKSRDIFFKTRADVSICCCGLATRWFLKQSCGHFQQCFWWMCGFPSVFFFIFFMAIKTSYYSRDVGQSVSVAMTHIQMVPVPKPNQSVSTALTKEK